MSKKLIITNEQYQKLIDYTIKEAKLDEELLDEGLWEKSKYLLSKLGRYKAGGKIMGKGKVDKEWADKIQAIIDKKGNEVIKNLDAQIKEKNPEFPNNEKGVDFLRTIMDISALYDSIVASTRKNPNEEGYLPPDAANGVINDLREYVKKFLDVDLTAAYSVVDEAEGVVVEISEDELKQLDEEYGLNEGDKTFYLVSPEGDVEDEIKASSVEDAKKKFEDELEGMPSSMTVTDIHPDEKNIDEDLAADARKALKGARAKGTPDFDSDRMKTLKSNKLPLLLAGVGASLGAFSWLTNTEWFKSLFEETFNYTDTEQIKDVIETKTQVLNDIKPGEGVYKLLSRVTNIKVDANQSPESLINALKQVGGGDAHKGIDLLCQKGGVMMRPDEAAKGLHDLVNNPDQVDKLGEFFKGGASGTGKIVPTNTTLYGTIAGKSLTGILVKQLPVIITKTVVKTGVKTGAGYAIAKGLGGVLGPIGIGLVAAGALVKLMRMKGQKQSRAATLNDLYQSIRNVEGGVGIVEPETDANKEGGDAKGGETDNVGGKDDKGNVPRGTGPNNDELYNTMRNLFGYIVQNKKTLAVKSPGELSGEKAPTTKTKKPKAAATSGGKVVYKDNKKTFSVGDRVSYKTKMGNIRIAKVQGKGVKDKNKINIKTEKNDIFDIDPKLLKLTPAKRRAIQESLIVEVKYIRDKDLYKYLNKNVSPDRVKKFEDFMYMLEMLRNKVRNLKPSEDKVFNSLVDKLKSNPLIITDFEKMLNVVSTNPQAYKNYAIFVNDILNTIYAGKYKKGDLVDKLAGVGKMKMDEAEYDKQFIDNAQDRKKFKKNVFDFLTDAIGLFQYMYKVRKQNASQSPRTPDKTLDRAKANLKNKQSGNTQSSNTQSAQQVSEINENKEFDIYVERVKKIIKIIG